MVPEPTLSPGARSSARPTDPRLERIVARVAPGARLVRATPLSPDAEPDSATTKGTGYGVPLLLEAQVDGKSQRWVLHVATPNPFGRDAADDVACMAINFVFFALAQPKSWQTAFSEMWFEFWRRYLELSGDAELLDQVPPFLAWRGLVLASPVWYPELGAEARLRLLDFVESALGSTRFDPALAEGMFA